MSNRKSLYEIGQHVPIQQIEKASSPNKTSPMQTSMENKENIAVDALKTVPPLEMPETSDFATPPQKISVKPRPSVLHNFDPLFNGEENEEFETFGTPPTSNGIEVDSFKTTERQSFGGPLLNITIENTPKYLNNTKKTRYPINFLEYSISDLPEIADSPIPVNNGNKSSDESDLSAIESEVSPETESEISPETESEISPETESDKPEEANLNITVDIGSVTQNIPINVNGDTTNTSFLEQEHFKSANQTLEESDISIKESVPEFPIEENQTVELKEPNLNLTVDIGGGSPNLTEIVDVSNIAICLEQEKAENITPVKSNNQSSEESDLSIKESEILSVDTTCDANKTVEHLKGANLNVTVDIGSDSSQKLPEIVTGEVSQENKILNSLEQVSAEESVIELLEKLCLSGCKSEVLADHFTTEGNKTVEHQEKTNLNITVDIGSDSTQNKPEITDVVTVSNENNISSSLEHKEKNITVSSLENKEEINTSTSLETKEENNTSNSSENKEENNTANKEEHKEEINILPLQFEENTVSTDFSQSPEEDSTSQNSNLPKVLTNSSLNNSICEVINNKQANTILEVAIQEKIEQQLCSLYATEDLSAEKEVETKDLLIEKTEDLSTEKEVETKDLLIENTKDLSTEKEVETKDLPIEKTKDLSTEKEVETKDLIIEKTVQSTEAQTELSGEINEQDLSNSGSTEQNMASLEQENSNLKQQLRQLQEKIPNLEQMLCDVKLQLNQSQQSVASLELQLRQKEEVTIKAQSEYQKKEQAYLQEIKDLTEKLEVYKEPKDNQAEIEDLRSTIQKMKLQEEELKTQVQSKNQDEGNYKHVLEEYKHAINMHVTELEKLKVEYDIGKQHLATLELAFSDVHQKYERSKSIITGYKNNEEALTQTLAKTEEELRKAAEKYESLKVHAKAQIDKSNRELAQAREKYAHDLTKLTTNIKRLEIKNASLNTALEQKVKECQAYASLCEELTGRENTS